MKTITRIAVVEDSARVRQQIVTTLNSRVDWQVVAACANAAQATRKIPAATPDLILLDIVLPASSGLELIAPLKSALPKTPIVMLTVVEETAKILQAIRAGASGYILKNDNADLIANLEIVCAGGAPVMSPTVARHLWEASKLSPEPPDHKFQLTRREWEVLRLRARGKQYGEIATALDIHIETVRNHVRHIYEKTGGHSTVEVLMRMSDRRGLLD